jgi:tetratricopeptide (TPR) repeat protein
MAVLRLLVILSIFVACACCWAADESQAPVDEKTFAQFLSEGAQLVQSRKPIEAISYFDKVIAGYEDAYKSEEAKLYCARWQVETVMYLLEAAKAKTSAKVVSANWAYAYYLKAYALLELGRIGEAKELLGRAIALSPRNSQFLSEMGNIYQREQNWPKALETFQAAEAAAREISPQDQKVLDQSRALRGLGYVFVEQRKLDEAEKVYRQCLELDSKDSRALNELRYIQGLRAKLSTQ